MSQRCKWLLEALEKVRRVEYPFDPGDLPAEHGIYFFYEAGEKCGHGSDAPRLVRIGTSDNVRRRISEHYLIDGARMNFDATKQAPHERSIFRKHIGGTLLHKAADPYLKVWAIDFTSRETLDSRGHLRDIEKEKAIEAEVTRILREQFFFRFILMDEEVRRGIEARLIGTIAQCGECAASSTWLGRFSPHKKVVASGVWHIQQLASPTIEEADQEMLASAIRRTLQWSARE